MRKRLCGKTRGKRIARVLFAVAIAAVLAGAMIAGGCAKEEPAEEVVETPAPEPEVVAEEPAPLVYPLTGLPVPDEDESLTLNRPLSVKIENSPEARPQLGIARADVVYESVTEGGITRFNCIFQSDIPE